MVFALAFACYRETTRCFLCESSNCHRECWKRRNGFVQILQQAKALPPSVPGVHDEIWAIAASSGPSQWLPVRESRYSHNRMIALDQNHAQVLWRFEGGSHFDVGLNSTKKPKRSHLVVQCVQCNPPFLVNPFQFF